MEQKKLTDKQKVILTEKLQERLLHAAIPAMVDELKRLTGEQRIVAVSEDIGNYECLFPTVLFLIGKGNTSGSIFPLPLTFEIKDVPVRTIAFFLNRLEQIFLPV